MESDGGLALDRRALDRVAVLGEGQRQSLMRMVLASLSLCLVLGGCASLGDKCVSLQIGDGSRADIIIGPWASISMQGPATWQSIPKDADPSNCGSLSEKTP